MYAEARAAGTGAVDAGFRVATGGLGGVMDAALRGARESPRYREGDTIAILPSHDSARASVHADIVLPTGLGHLRNGIVAACDAVIAVGGGAGTLSEMTFAWMMGRLIVAVPLSGWSRELADRPIDDRPRHPTIPDDRVYAARDGADAVAIVNRLLPLYPRASR